MYSILTGDCLQTLKKVEDGSINTCITSPPYFGLRDYDIEGQIGLEETPDEYIARLVEVFREVRRCLRDDGTLWVNIGDGYNARPGQRQTVGKAANKQAGTRSSCNTPSKHVTDCKPKDLLGIPWMLAFALRADGWYLRQEIIWEKPNAMPESVRDRCTKSHEHVFLLSKSPRYYFDHEAIREPATSSHNSCNKGRKKRPSAEALQRGNQAGSIPFTPDGLRNKRTVWSVPTQKYAGEHDATFPPDLITPCVLAGAPVGGIVLDPFGGSGTTAAVAEAWARDSIICDLNPAYTAQIPDRVSAVIDDILRKATQEWKNK